MKMINQFARCIYRAFFSPKKESSKMIEKATREAWAQALIQAGIPVRGKSDEKLKEDYNNLESDEPVIGTRPKNSTPSKAGRVVRKRKTEAAVKPVEAKPVEVEKPKLKPEPESQAPVTPPVNDLGLAIGSAISAALGSRQSGLSEERVIELIYQHVPLALLNALNNQMEN